MCNQAKSLSSRIHAKTPSHPSPASWVRSGFRAKNDSSGRYFLFVHMTLKEACMQRKEQGCQQQAATWGVLMAEAWARALLGTPQDHWRCCWDKSYLMLHGVLVYHQTFRSGNKLTSNLPSSQYESLVIYASRKKKTSQYFTTSKTQFSHQRIKIIP